MPISYVASFRRSSPLPVIEWTVHDDEDCSTCSLLTRKGRREKLANVAAKRRKVNEAMKKEEAEVEAACDTILNKQHHSSCTKKLQQVASAIIKQRMKETASDTIQLPTGGPVSNFSTIESQMCSHGREVGT